MFVYTTKMHLQLNPSLTDFIAVSTSVICMNQDFHESACARSDGSLSYNICHTLDICTHQIGWLPTVMDFLFPNQIIWWVRPCTLTLCPLRQHFFFETFTTFITVEPQGAHRVALADLGWEAELTVRLHWQLPPFMTITEHSQNRNAHTNLPWPWWTLALCLPKSSFTFNCFPHSIQ